MHWLQQNAFLAAWLSPVIAIIGLLIRSRKAGEMDWGRALLYIAFLTCLAAQFTPALDAETHSNARLGMVFFSGFIMADVAMRWGQDKLK